MQPRNLLTETQLNHRSIRQFTEQPIEAELLEHLIHCGQAAASSSFIQAYSIIQVNQLASRQQIAQLAGGQVWVEQAPVFLVFCADLYRVQQASLLQGSGELEGYTEHFLAATVDVALMAQNVLLAAESYGLGGVFIGGIRNNPQAVSELLQLPELVYPVFGLCLGYPQQETAVKPRFPVRTVLHQDYYNVDAVKCQVETYDAEMQVYYQQRTRNARASTWSAQTAQAVQGKLREHMLNFLRNKGFLKQ